MTKLSTSVQVFLGLVNHSDAVKINSQELPDFWHSMVTSPYYADTWRFTGFSRGHAISMVNETAYVDEDTSRDYADYWFDVGSPNGDV